jgi:hypothetical protein
MLAAPTIAGGHAWDDLSTAGSMRPFMTADTPKILEPLYRIQTDIIVEIAPDGRTRHRMLVDIPTRCSAV